ncbi:unnamed protein product [Moneuplotes crassus]|uniref:USP domain-containing protein n=1 Tax=Euplotes crassus TaxID=5936 RepID=A0AAD1X7N0_EUPCR|nr:unnamed protein product [Moneuplotes crassus]
MLTRPNAPKIMRKEIKVTQRITLSENDGNIEKDSKGSLPEIRNSPSSYNENSDSKSHYSEADDLEIGLCTSTCEPKGMINESNDCFFIACLQFLLCIPEFVDYLKSWKPDNRESPILESLIKISNEIDNKADESPVDISHCRKLFNDEFEEGYQHCANQLILALFDKIQFSCNNVTKVFQCYEEKDSDKVWEQYLSDRGSIVDKLFVGMYKRSFKCKECLIEQIHYDEFKSIPLPCTKESGKSMPGVISNIGEEVEESTFLCKKKCKGERDCTITATIIHYPEYLILPFQRQDCFTQEKIEEKMYFNQEFTEAHHKIEYTLQSFIFHMGSLDSGHYFSLCKVGESWYKCNDERVTKVDPENLEGYKDNAYILIYKKKAN